MRAIGDPVKKKKNTSSFWYAKSSVKHNSLNEDLPSSGFGDNVFC